MASDRCGTRISCTRPAFSSEPLQLAADGLSDALHQRANHHNQYQAWQRPTVCLFIMVTRMGCVRHFDALYSDCFHHAMPSAKVLLSFATCEGQKVPKTWVGVFLSGRFGLRSRCLLFALTPTNTLILASLLQRRQTSCLAIGEGAS